MLGSRHPQNGSGKPRVIVVRGHQANPWELRQWERPAVQDRFDVAYLRPRRGWFDTSLIDLASERVWTLRDLLPPGSIGDLAVRIPGDRYIGLARALDGADIVHAQELGYWYAMQSAALKQRLGFRLVLTVWETIPFLGAFRNIRTRRYRELVLREADLFLAATERARTALMLEGAPSERIRVCPPGVLTNLADGPRPSSQASAQPLILSPGRIVWEKGHQDVMRALAVLRRGYMGEPIDARLRIVGRGPDERRLRAYAAELQLDEVVEFSGFIPHDELLGSYQAAACVVLASLPLWSWEEQFGMVLAEAAAAGTPIVASQSGALPEVAAGGQLFASGDWIGLARVLGDIIRSPRPPVTELDERYSVDAAAERLATAYDDVLAEGPREGRRPAITRS